MSKILVISSDAMVGEDLEYYRQLLKVERAAVEELGGWHAGD